jgi:hypothetical protein
MFASTPRTPMVPFKLASQPGAAIVNCHGSLSVMLGGAVSFGYSSNVPALREEMNADAAPANKKNRSFMCRVLSNDVLIGKITLQRSSAIFRYILRPVYWTLGPYQAPFRRSQAKLRAVGRSQFRNSMSFDLFPSNRCCGSSGRG